MIGKCFKVKSWKDYLKGFVTGMLFIIITIGITTAQAARSIRVQDFTTISWFFVIVGALVILLQLIPAVLLFATFITGVYRRGPLQQKELDGLVFGQPAIEKENK